MKMATPLEGRGNFFYEVISKVDNKDWLRFVRTKLILEENLIDDIIHDNKDHVEEQKYQMLLKWDLRQGPDETIGKLKNLVNDFYNAMIFSTDPDTSRLALPQHSTICFLTSRRYQAHNTFALPSSFFCPSSADLMNYDPSF
ncbi:unnamed protein product [Clavelina lepadiformis]|uniref:Death domain-containing protein n=1 Tax=Clavelina lepadiformis TaxID=159417 RepID=A0ABP0GJ78_CLALP